MEPKHRRLLECAVALIAKNGPSGLSLRTIAKELDCSTMVVYTAFGSKSGLLSAVAKDGFESLKIKMESAIAKASGLAALEALALAYRKFSLAHPSHYRVMFGRVDAEYVPDESAMKAGEDAFALVVETVKRAGAKGEIRADDPRLVAEILWSLVHGLVSLEMDGQFGTAAKAARRFTLATSLLLASLSPKRRA